MRSLEIKSRLGGFTLVLLLASLIAPLARIKAAPVYRWTTLAGRAGVGSEDGPRASARFNAPHGLAYDLAGNLYVADTGNHTIRKISADGQVTTFAGKAGQSGSSDGTNATARFNSPQGLAVDQAGNLYVADTGNHTVRKISPAGIVTTLGGQPGKAGTADGPAGVSLFDTPTRLTVDATGNVYLSNHGVRKITGGTVSTLTVPTQVTDIDGRTLLVKTERCPAVDADGYLYFATQTGANTLYLPHAGQYLKVAPGGSYTVLRASSFKANDSGSTYDQRLFSDTLFSDAAGRLFVAMEIRNYYNLRFVRGARLLPDGRLDEDNAILFQNAISTPVFPLAVAQSSSGEWRYTCANEHAIKTATGTYAGTPPAAEGIDATGSDARFQNATSLAVDPAGNVWLTETASRYYYSVPYGFDPYTTALRIRQISPAGTVLTFALSPQLSAFNPPNSAIVPMGIHADGTGTVTFARFDHGVSQSYLNQIFPGGSVTEMNAPTGFATDPVIANSGNLYVLNYNWSSGAYRITRREVDGTWSTFAGDKPPGVVDGIGTAASFNLPMDLAENRNGHLFLLDTVYPDGTTANAPFDAYIRRITPAGSVTTVGQKLTNRPTGLAADQTGNFFLTHASSHTVTRIDPAGKEVIIGGIQDWAGSADGDGTAAQFASPEKLTLDAQGRIYVIDGGGTTVRQGQLVGESPDITSQPQSQTVTAGATASFSITATSSTALTYQWLLNGTALAGATTNTLTLANARTTDAGSYSVIVSNTFGSITSNSAILTVTSAPTPPSSGGNGSSGGGGGAPSLWFLHALTLLTLLRWLCTRRASPTA